MKTKFKQSKCQYYVQVEICNTLYKLGIFIVINTDKSEIEFGQIKNIVSLDNEIYFDLNLFEEITFDEHVNAYIVYRKMKPNFLNF